jgi:uncharacterized integral membrane protein
LRGPTTFNFENEAAKTFVNEGVLSSNNVRQLYAGTMLTTCFYRMMQTAGVCMAGVHIHLSE